MELIIVQTIAVNNTFPVKTRRYKSHINLRKTNLINSLIYNALLSTLTLFNKNSKLKSLSLQIYYYFKNKLWYLLNAPSLGARGIITDNNSLSFTYWHLYKRICFLTPVLNTPRLYSTNTDLRLYLTNFVVWPFFLKKAVLNKLVLFVLPFTFTFLQTFSNYMPVSHAYIFINFNFNFFIFRNLYYFKIHNY